MLTNSERVRTSAILTQKDVAHIVGLPLRSVQAWSRRTKSGAPLITQGRRGNGPTPPTIPLIGLSEATVLQQLSERGVPARRFGRAVREAKESDPMFFARNDVYTDGTDFFRQFDGDLERLRDGQFALRDVFGDFLRRVVFDDGVMQAFRLNPDDDVPVIIDPRFSAGRPILRRTGTPVFAVLSAIEAGERWDLITEDYPVEMSEVKYVADHRTELAPVA